MEVDYTRCQAFKSYQLKPNWPEKSFLPAKLPDIHVKDEMIGGCKNGGFSQRQNIGNDKKI